VAWFLDVEYETNRSVMRKMPVVVLRVVQFWMAAGLFAAMIVSTALATPFLIAGKIMDYLKGQPCQKSRLIAR
jgi:hypothetical protein